MTLKQRKLAKGIAAGLNGKDAAIAAGYSPKSAKSIASDTLCHNLPVQAYLYRLMDRRGLTDAHLLKELDDDLTTCNNGIANATRVISARVIVKSDDPTVKLEEATSRTDDFIEVEDHHAKIGYLREKHDRLQTAWKLRGHLLPQSTPLVSQATQITIVNAYRPAPLPAPGATDGTDG